MDDQQLLSIGEAAQTLGTTARTLRYYDQRGVVPASVTRAGGIRAYGPAALNRARQVLRLRRLGVSLDDIHAVVASDDVNVLNQVLAAQLMSVDEQVGRLKSVRSQLKRLTSQIDSFPIPTATALDTLEELGMIRISNVYTRTGDDGTTDLGDGIRIPKGDPRLDCAGDLDELVCALGMALSLDDQDYEVLREIQNQLFDLGTDSSRSARFVQELEDWCDAANSSLEPLSSWVLPGGDPYSAAVHQARAVCRRAERRCWDAEDEGVARYLNRLSDLLFILARRAGASTETLWLRERGGHMKP